MSASVSPPSGRDSSLISRMRACVCLYAAVRPRDTLSRPHLVWYEVHESMESAIVKEKSLKKWNRAWKLRLIQRDNPEWMDLYDEIC